MKEPFILLFFFFFGAFISYFNIVLQDPIQKDLSEWLIYIMLFLAGANIGSNAQAWRIIRELKGKIILVPFLVLIGTLIGGAMSWFIIQDLLFRDIIAISSGLGYYSLASMLITQYTNPTLGSTALLVNMMRELLTFILAPLFVRIGGKFGPLSVAGASSETCLTTIIKVSGEYYAIISLFSGVVLTVCVPIIISLIYT